jgi:hypothetical protein
MVMMRREQGMTEDVKHLREWWLYAAASFLLEMMHAASLPTVSVRVSCGWPVSGGLGDGPHVIGQCFAQEVCADGVSQIFISPRIADSIQVLGTLLHELIHASVGCRYGHRRQFSQPARQLGLVGPPTATTVGPELAQVLQVFVEQMGPYPHAPIVMQKKAKAGSRMRLYECRCEPVVKLRAARDDLQVLCLVCEAMFVKVEQEEDGE